MLPSGYTFWSQGQPQGLGPLAWMCQALPGWTGSSSRLVKTQADSAATWQDLASFAAFCTSLNSSLGGLRTSLAPCSALSGLPDEMMKCGYPFFCLVPHIEGEKNITFGIITTILLVYFKTKPSSKSETSLVSLIRALSTEMFISFVLQILSLECGSILHPKPV